MTLTWIIITIVSTWYTMGHSWLRCGDYGWVYYETPSHIEIYVCDVGDWHGEFYILHEKAHFIYKKVLSQAQRDEYGKLYLSHLKYWQKAFFRDYSMSNVEEDFADNYWIVKSKNPYVKKRIRLINKFIKNMSEIKSPYSNESIQEYARENNLDVLNSHQITAKFMEQDEKIVVLEWQISKLMAWNFALENKLK